MKLSLAMMTVIPILTGFLFLSCGVRLAQAYQCMKKEWMGFEKYFSCPQPKDDDDAKYCCGLPGSQYCCEYDEYANYLSGGAVAAIIIGIIVFLAVVTLLSCCCCSCCLLAKRRRSAGVVLSTPQPTSNIIVYPHQQGYSQVPQSYGGGVASAPPMYPQAPPMHPQGPPMYPQAPQPYPGDAFGNPNMQQPPYPMDGPKLPPYSAT